MKRRKYTSMQEELAARKAAGEFGGEEPVNRPRPFEAEKSKQLRIPRESPFAESEKFEENLKPQRSETEEEGRKKTHLLALAVLLAFAAWIMVDFLSGSDEDMEDVWQDGGILAEEYGITEDSTDSEVDAAIFQFTTAGEYAGSDVLYPWSQTIPEMVGNLELGTWSSSVAAGRVLIRAECGEEDDAEELAENWIEASDIMMESLSEEGLDDIVYVSVILREQGTNKLRLILIDGEREFASGDYL